MTNNTFESQRQIMKVNHKGEQKKKDNNVMVDTKKKKHHKNV